METSQVTVWVPPLLEHVLLVPTDTYYFSNQQFAETHYLIVVLQYHEIEKGL